MPFLELTLHCTQSDHPHIEAALDELGALSVTLIDADAATPDERAIPEPEACAALLARHPQSLGLVH